MKRETPSIVSTLISSAIDRLAPRKTQRELAKAIGFKTANMLSMLRTGDAKVPFAKIPIIAEVLEIDPALLLRLHLRETWPEFESVVFEIFRGVLTRAEREWIEFFANAGVLVPPPDAATKQKLGDFLESLDWGAES